MMPAIAPPVEEYPAPDRDLQSLLHWHKCVCALERRCARAHGRRDPDRGFSTEPLVYKTSLQPLFRSRMVRPGNRSRCFPDPLCPFSLHNTLLANVVSGIPGLHRNIPPDRTASGCHPGSLRQLCRGLVLCSADHFDNRYAASSGTSLKLRGRSTLALAGTRRSPLEGGAR